MGCIVEKLAALLIFCLSGFGSAESYFSELDRQFLEHPDDEVLFELEDCFKDLRGHWACLLRHFEFGPDENFDKKLFGGELSRGLEKFFDENVGTGKVSLKKFGRLGYTLWRLLSDLNFDVHGEPFVILCYADEPLDYGDERQSLEIYKYFFDFYKEKK